MTSYRGYVNGLDAQATPGVAVRCQAFVNQSPTVYIQVTAYEHQLQTALETASLRSPTIQVEVTYDEKSADKRLTRVQILDR